MKSHERITGMIQEKNGLFTLNTKNTSYVFKLHPSGHLEHLHYGRKIKTATGDALIEKHSFAPGNTVLYSSENKGISLEDMPLEFSSYGKGDIKEPFMEITHDDGSSTSDFLYTSHRICSGREKSALLPGSYGTDSEVETLEITLTDKEYGLLLYLSYYVYEEDDVICRRARLSNNSSCAVTVKRLLSNSLTLFGTHYEVTSFHGTWGREMQRQTTLLNAGKYVVSSHCGTSGSRANPLFFVSGQGATEDSGEVYGFNLIYSGNHYEAVEPDSYGHTRIVTGMSPVGFQFLLNTGESLEAPEAVMTYSHLGFTPASHHFHSFIRNHIVRGSWQYKERPVLINSWEASYFHFTENSLLRLAREAAKVGIELFVMDDGWFGERNDDEHSLGDWTVNRTKLPHGLKAFSEQIHELGMDFGLWVEPEMVNTKSLLYREHPDWTCEIPGKPHSEGRNQRILDLCNPAVQDYIIESMSQVFSSADISYVKWDMNRIFSDCYSPYLSADRQGETLYRYYAGLYRIMRELTEQFPHILFEGCAAGGNRFDLGILCYFPQIWASDNTDAVCRLDIQDGYSYGYPMSTVSCHVSSCPNHQTLRITPFESRFNVAAFGILGYECNLCDMKKEELEAIAEQTALYKAWRKTLQYGDFYRIRHGNIFSWNTVSKDKSRSVGLLMQKLSTAGWQHETFRAKGLLEDALYTFSGRTLKHSIKNFGDLINTVSPVHVKQDSLLHNVLTKFVKMDGETELYDIYGDALMYSGVKLKQGFSATGYSDEVRYFQDFCSRIYFMEEKEEKVKE